MLVAQYLVDTGRRGPGFLSYLERNDHATIFLTLSKKVHRQCVPIIYRNVQLGEYSALDFAQGVLNTKKDDQSTKDRKRAYRQAITSITFLELPSISTSDFWQSGLDITRTPQSPSVVFPLLESVVNWKSVHQVLGRAPVGQYPSQLLETEPQSIPPVYSCIGSLIPRKTYCGFHSSTHGKCRMGGEDFQGCGAE